MTVGIPMDQEICLILGEVSISLLHEMRNLQTENVVRRETIIYGQNSGRQWESMPS